MRNARSTVGTITEIHDVLRLLFTHLGEVACPRGHGRARTFTPEEAALDLAAGAGGDPFLLVARLPRPPRHADAALAELIRQGFNRRLDGAGAAGPGVHRDEVTRMEPGERWPAARDPLPLVLGRFPAHAEAGARVLATLPPGRRPRRGSPGGPGGHRSRPHLQPRPGLPGLRRGGPPPDAAPVLVQLAARRLPDLPGLRAGHRHRPRARHPRPPPLARRAPDRALEHAGLRGALRRAAGGGAPPAHPGRRALGRPAGRGARVGLERRRPLRQPRRLLFLARAAHLQGARPGAARPLPFLWRFAWTAGPCPT